MDNKLKVIASSLISLVMSVPWKRSKRSIPVPIAVAEARTVNTIIDDLPLTLYGIIVT